MTTERLVAQSAVQKLLTGRQLGQVSKDRHQHLLALQICHNLRFQHNWTNLRIHSTNSHDGRELPVPIISGLPPQRLYVHPDEQIDLLQKQKNEGKVGMPELQSELEWILPTHLRERWTLARFGAVFDDIETVPSHDRGNIVDFGGVASNDRPVDDTTNPWRTTKRLLLATVDDDSTVVYYIVHDGIVKPRQN